MSEASSTSQMWSTIEPELSDFEVVMDKSLLPQWHEVTCLGLVEGKILGKEFMAGYSPHPLRLCGINLPQEKYGFGYDGDILATMQLNVVDTYQGDDVRQERKADAD